VNLNHFTLPQWVAERGGWENDSAVIWFGRYAEKIAQNFKPLKITWWMTFNEPGVIISRGYLDGKYPPGKKISPAAAYRVVRNLYRAHALAYRKLHEILDYPQRKVLVGIAHYTTRYASYLSFLPDPTVFEIDSISGSLDYIGLNYYGLTGVRFFGNTIVEFKTEVSPEGIYDLVRDFQSYGKPIIISENGIDDSADVLRPKFIVEHLFWLHRAIQDSVVKGVPIIGYFYWTFIDNYEWDRLAISRMGLVEFDIKTRARKPRPSAYLFRDIARVNGVTPKILEKHRVHEKNRD
jgi:beta-glucosidase